MKPSITVTTTPPTTSIKQNESFMRPCRSIAKLEAKTDTKGKRAFSNTFIQQEALLDSGWANYERAEAATQSPNHSYTFSDILRNVFLHSSVKRIESGLFTPNGYQRKGIQPPPMCPTDGPKIEDFEGWSSIVFGKTAERQPKRERPMKNQMLVTMGSKRGYEDERLASVVSCSCQKSKCVKLYCECFRDGQPCGPTCRCVDCLNIAPGKKRTKIGGTSIKKNRPICHCKRSSCGNNYCPCYMSGLGCGPKCGCLECKNIGDIAIRDCLPSDKLDGNVHLMIRLAFLIENYPQKELR